MTAPTTQGQYYSDCINNAVTPQYLKTRWENTKLQRVALGSIADKGGIKPDASGVQTEWLATIGEFQDAYHVDLGTRNFQRANFDVRYAAYWSFLEVTDVLSENDLTFLRSANAIYNAAEKRLEKMSQDFMKRLNYRMLQENASGNTVAGIPAVTTPSLNPFFGLPTIFGYGSAAIGYNPDTQASTGIAVVAGDREVLPNTSYCQVSTHPTNAISGVTNKRNESTSPVIANWTSTGWNSASGTSWLVNAQDVLEHMIIRLGRGGAEEDPDTGILTKRMYEQFKQNLRGGSGLQRHVVMTPEVSEPDAGMYKRRRIPFNGVDFFFDDDMPTNLGYLLNTKMINFRYFPGGNVILDNSLGGSADQMFSVKCDYDINVGGHKSVVKVAGQMIANPRYQGMFYAFA